MFTHPLLHTRDSGHNAMYLCPDIFHCYDQHKWFIALKSFIALWGFPCSSNVQNKPSLSRLYSSRAPGRCLSANSPGALLFLTRLKMRKIVHNMQWLAWRLQKMTISFKFVSAQLYITWNATIKKWVS